MAKKDGKESKLTIKQRKFIDRYIETGKKRQSAIDAGYAPKYADRQANQTLHLDYVQDYLNEQMNRLSLKGIASAYDVLKVWSNILWGKEMETVVAPNSTTVTVPPNNAQKIAAGKEIMKRWPDQMVKAKIAQTQAETKLTNAKTKMLTDTDDNTENSLSDILDKIEDKELGKKDDDK